MQTTTLPNRPEVLPPRTKIIDLDCDTCKVRVSLKLIESAPDIASIDAQAFEVDAEGRFVFAPDGRPSRTPSSGHNIIASSLGDTHTLGPGWVRVVNSYGTEWGAPTTGKPTEAGAIGDRAYDAATQVGYEYVAGEIDRIARGKATEMCNILANSSVIAGLDF